MIWVAVAVVGFLTLGIIGICLVGSGDPISPEMSERAEFFDEQWKREGEREVQKHTG